MALATAMVASAAGANGAGAAAPHASASAAISAAQVRSVLNPAPHVHIMPTQQMAQRISASVRPDTGNVTYHGGPVMLQNYSVAIFWMPSTLQSGASATPSANYPSLISRYLADIGGSAIYNVTTQYSQHINGPAEFITNSSGQVIAVVDTSAYPAAGTGCGNTNGQDCVDNSQVQAEITKVINAHPALTPGFSTEYYVFLAPHESECTFSDTCFNADTDPTPQDFQFCAYHSLYTLGSQKVVYATLPYGGKAFGNGCKPNGLVSFPNDNDADIEINSLSHEQMETTTDPTAGEPFNSGWYNIDTSGEIADECANSFGTVDPNTHANVVINGHPYLVQEEWSNAESGCSLGTTPSQPFNDNFANAFALPPQGGTNVVNAYNITATKEAGEPNNAGNSGGKSVWWSWTPSGSGTVEVDTCGTFIDTTIGVYTGTAVNNLTSVASNNDSNACGTGSHQSAVTFFASFGTTYMISVDGFNAGGGASNGNFPLSTTSLAGAGAVPGKPTISGVTAGDGWVNVAWNAPSSTGATPIGTYAVTVGSKTVKVPGDARRAVVTGLTNGTAVTATVRAVNLGGPGLASTPSSPVTPAHAPVNVTTQYDASDNTRLLKNATDFGTDAIGAQRESVGIIAFIAGVVHSPVVTPVVPTPVTSGPNSYTTPWATADQGPLVTVMRQYALTPPEAQYFSVTLVGFLLALGGH